MSRFIGFIATTAIALLTIGSLSTLSIGQRPPPIGGGGSVQPSGPRPAPEKNREWHLLHYGNKIFRFNSQTGATQVAVIDSKGNGNWAAFGELSGGLSVGEPGRYEVIAGDNPFGQVVRIDTQTGQTWGTSNDPNGTQVGSNSSQQVEHAGAPSAGYAFRRVTPY